MSLKALVQSYKRGEILLPRLKAFLADEEGNLKNKQVVIEDAKLTIACFKERIKEYNHGEIKGDYFHPSQLGQCMRKLWFSVMKAPTNGEPSADDLLQRHVTFEIGTYTHVFMQNLIQRAGLLESREIAILNPKLRILGHADGIVEIDGIRYLLELKTCNSRTFTGLKEIKPDHKKQIHAYMKALKLGFALVIYIDKDRSQLKEFVVQYSPKFYELEVEPRIELFFTSIRNKEMPDREGVNPNAFPCNYCEFSRVCFETAEHDRFLKRLQNENKKNNSLNEVARRFRFKRKVFKFPSAKKTVIHGQSEVPGKID